MTAFAKLASDETALSDTQLTKANYGVWGRPREPTDEPAAAVLGGEAIMRGADRSSSRRLRNAYGKAVYATPVSGGICLSSADYTVTRCRPQELLPTDAGSDAMNDVGGTSCSPYLPNDKMVFAGLVPDGVADVAMRRADGERTEVEIKDNLFLAVLDRAETPVVELTWTDDSTGIEHSRSSPLPPDAVNDRCVPQDAADIAATVSKAKEAAARLARDMRGTDG
jgi:hypothetical protein